MNAPYPALELFEERIKVTFTDRDLLQQVFVHRSYINEHRGFKTSHNERLEFLGDAVLELVVTEHLYITYPNPEGELTNWRSALVKGETLADVALGLGFSEYLLLSKGEQKSGGRNKGVLLANAFEALVGAMYLDQGFDTCKTFLHTCIISLLPAILEQQLFIDPKSRLQEYTQEHFSITPSYNLVEETGPDHAKAFTIAVMVGEKELARGSGPSKQSAQISAAQAALTEIVASATELG